MALIAECQDVMVQGRWRMECRIFAGAAFLPVAVLLASCNSDPSDPGTVGPQDGDGIHIEQRSLDPGSPPSANFDLSHWSLTLPSGDEVSTAELEAGFQASDSFHTDPRSGGLTFRSPNVAGRTDNSNYSRSELREMLAPAGAPSAQANNWTAARGGVLKARLRVDAVSTTGKPEKAGRIVIGQIHGPETEVVRLYYDKKPDEAKGRLYVGTDRVEQGSGSFSEDIVPNSGDHGIALGEIFEYQLELDELDLRVTVVEQGKPGAVFAQGIDPRYDGLPLYFKAGLYNQNNTGDVADFAQATFMALEASHPVQ